MLRNLPSPTLIVSRKLRLIRLSSVFLTAIHFSRNGGDRQEANNESSEVIDILLPVTFYFNPSTKLDNVKNL